MKSKIHLIIISNLLLVSFLLCCFTFASCRNSDSKLEYKVNSDGITCTITGIGNYSSKDLYIPEKIDGYIVTAIADYAFQGTDIVTFSGTDSITVIGKYAFQNCKQLQIADIPTGVTKIGEHCFEYCESLRTVDLPSNLKSIESHTFSECRSIETINLPEGIIEIGDLAFYSCIYLTSINIPNTTKKIGMCTFAACASLTNIIIPDGVTDIGDGAFIICWSLSSIYFPASVVNVGKAVISNNNLTSIDVDVDNPMLSSIDGNLYSNNNTIFINYACAKSENSFGIPDGVTKILTSSFAGCNNLKIISIPKSVYYIGSQIFYTSPNIEAIYYDDTVENWHKILKSPDWNKNTESVFTIVCTDGTIAMDGTVTYNQ